MRTNELLRRAKVEIDLPGFLGARGWRGVPGKDSYASRCLDGPGNSRVIVSRAQDGHWQWFDARDGRGGSIVDACTRLLGMRWAQAMGELRAALANSPALLPVAGPAPGAHRSTPGASTVRNQPVVQSLGERGRAYLTARRHLARETVQTFAHALRENDRGSVRACHNTEHGDGEERGEAWKGFVGSQADGEGRGRGLWIAFPAPLCSRLVVAESFISGLSAWEMLPSSQRMITGVVSTGGAISAAGAEQLEWLLEKMREDHTREHTGRKVWLFDASDQGEGRTKQRTAFMAATAERAAVSYWRYAPRGAQDWNDALAAAKGLPRYQDVRSAELAVKTDEQVSEGPEEGITLS